MVVNVKSMNLVKYQHSSKTEPKRKETLFLKFNHLFFQKPMRLETLTLIRCFWTILAKDAIKKEVTWTPFDLLNVSRSFGV